MISGSPAVRREMERFELMRIWTRDPQREEQAAAQAARMKKQFGTSAIPLHVILDGQGREVARFDYKGGFLSTPDDYLEFLRKAK
jgi:hypothetical protein